MALEQRVKQRVDGVIQSYWVKYDEEQQQKIEDLRKEAIEHMSENGPVSGDVETLLGIDPGKTSFLVREQRNGVVRNNGLFAFMSFENDPGGEACALVPAGEAKFIGDATLLEDGTIVGNPVMGVDGKLWRLEQGPDDDTTWLCTDMGIEGGEFQRHSEVGEEALEELSAAEADSDSAVLTWDDYEREAQKARQEWADEPDPREGRVESWDDEPNPREGRVESWDEDREPPTEEFLPVGDDYEPHTATPGEPHPMGEDDVFGTNLGAPSQGSGGFVNWPDGLDADMAFANTLNSSAGCKDMLYMYGYSKAPEGYPGEYIFHGINVKNKKQQNCVDALCRESDLRREYKKMMRNPNATFEQRTELRDAYINAKSDAKMVRREFNRAKKYARWERRLEEKPIVYGVLGSTLTRSKIAAHRVKGLGVKYWNHKKAQSEKRKEYYDNVRKQRSNKKRSRNSLLRRILVGGLKMKFLSKILN